MGEEADFKKEEFLTIQNSIEIGKTFAILV